MGCAQRRANEARRARRTYGHRSGCPRSAPPRHLTIPFATRPPHRPRALRRHRAVSRLRVARPVSHAGDHRLRPRVPAEIAALARSAAGGSREGATDRVHPLGVEPGDWLGQQRLRHGAQVVEPDRSRERHAVLAVRAELRCRSRGRCASRARLFADRFPRVRQRQRVLDRIGALGLGPAPEQLALADKSGQRGLGLSIAEFVDKVVQLLPGSHPAQSIAVPRRRPSAADGDGFLGRPPSSARSPSQAKESCRAPDRATASPRRRWPSRPDEPRRGCSP